MVLPEWLYFCSILQLIFQFMPYILHKKLKAIGHNEKSQRLPHLTKLQDTKAQVLLENAWLELTVRSSIIDEGALQKHTMGSRKVLAL